MNLSDIFKQKSTCEVFLLFQYPFFVMLTITDAVARYLYFYLSEFNTIHTYYRYMSLDMKYKFLLRSNNSKWYFEAIIYASGIYIIPITFLLLWNVQLLRWQSLLELSVARQPWVCLACKTLQYNTSDIKIFHCLHYILTFKVTLCENYSADFNEIYTRYRGVYVELTYQFSSDSIFS